MSAINTSTRITNPALEFHSTLARAIQRLRRKINIDDELQDARMLLEAMLMTTGEFGVAINRLNNAARYLASDEFGAASWELNTLRNELLNRSK